MKRLLLTALACLPFYAQADDVAKTIVMQGNGKGAPACEQCHGADGGGTPAAGFPRLAGLQEEYIKHQLLSFRTGKRNNPIMEPIAKSLSAKEVSSLAVYFAALPVPAATAAAGDAALLGKGKAIATRGDWSHEIPACFQCHGPEGKGVGTTFPPIAGQSALYISNQIAAWKAGSRSNDPVGLMRAVADRLSAEQVEAVSAYLANQSLINGDHQ